MAPGGSFRQRRRRRRSCCWLLFDPLGKSLGLPTALVLIGWKGQDRRHYTSHAGRCQRLDRCVRCEMNMAQLRSEFLKSAAAVAAGMPL